MHILGIGVGHDAAACLLADGEIVAMAAEERFTRIKHDAGFPTAAIACCLATAGLEGRDLDVLAIAASHLPLDLERHLVLSPSQQAALAAARPRAQRVAQARLLDQLGDLPLSTHRLALAPSCRLAHVNHHRCHAASAYYTRRSDSPCLVLTLDGIGDGISTAIWQGAGGRLTPLRHWGREGSLGWFYGTVTEALGWEHGDGEGTTMALAAFGDSERLLDRLAPFHPAYDGGDLSLPHDFGRPTEWHRHGRLHWHFAEADPIRRLAEEHGAADVAGAAQEILERQVLGLVRHWSEACATRRLACGGGVFLNVKLNQRIWYEAGLEEQWIMPDAGDSGLALGAALQVWHAEGDRPPRPLEHLSFGPAFSDAAVREVLQARRLRSSPDSGSRRCRRPAAGRWADRRLVPGANGGGAAGFGQPLDPDEPARCREQGRPECPGEIP